MFSLDSTTVGFGGLGYSSAAPKVCQGIKKNSALVIERYQKANDENPNGRLTIVVGDKLFYDGENPFAKGLFLLLGLFHLAKFHLFGEQVLWIG